MYDRLRHVCGGIAHLVGRELILGWNLYCCNRCGESYYHWITKEMLDQHLRQNK